MKKLQDIQEILNRDTITKDEFMAAFTAILTVVKQNKAMTAQELSDMKGMLSDALDRMTTGSTQMTESAKQEVMEYCMTEMKKAMDKMEAKMMDVDEKMDTVVSGKDADEIKIIETVLSKIPPVKELAPETPESVRDKLETLKEDDRLDKSAIKGIDKLEERVKSVEIRPVRGAGGRALLQLYVDGSKKGAIQYLNLIGGAGVTLTYASTNGRNDVAYDLTPQARIAFLAKVDANNTTPLQIQKAALEALPAPSVSETPLKSEVGRVVKDIIPTKKGYIKNEITLALDLTQGDVKNIAASTGNDAAEFILNKKLIGNNVEETVNNLKNYYRVNYKAVRDEIEKVKAKYPANTIPRYKEALTSIKTQIQDVPGLQKENIEVDTLLSKKLPILNDVQRVKELMDEHFSLYKVTGDVKEGVAKSGLTNIRSDLREFIEQQVKLKTGADISALNNNVATSRTIADAIETRSTRALTRAALSPTDMVAIVSGFAFGGPIGSIGALIAKKIYQNPSNKLKFARFLDGLSDARKAEIQQKLDQGLVPEEIQKIYLESSNESNQFQSAPNNESNQSPN